MNVFTTPQGAFQRHKYISDSQDANIYKTTFLSPVCQFELHKPEHNLQDLHQRNTLCHTQGSYPPFVPTLTSSDPEASLKYSLAIFSNPHIHSLWLCWEMHSVKAKNNLNKSIFKAFASQLQAYEAVFQSPNSSELTHSLRAVAQLVPQAAQPSLPTAGSNAGGRGYERDTGHKWLRSAEIQLGDRGLPASIRALQEVFEDLRQSFPKSLRS